MPTSTWAIVVAAGSGERFGARKQFLRLGYGRVVDWALRSAREHCAGVVLVVPADSLGEPESLHPADVVVAGGSTRSASVRQGLAAVPPEAEVVVVHDGRSEEHPSELQSLMRISYAVFCLKTKKNYKHILDTQNEST